MKRAFRVKVSGTSHDLHVAADYVMFEPGFVVFCDGPPHVVPFIVTAIAARKVSEIVEIKEES
jgi:hypothetical protein